MLFQSEQLKNQATHFKELLKIDDKDFSIEKVEKAYSEYLKEEEAFKAFTEPIEATFKDLETNPNDFSHEKVTMDHREADLHYKIIESPEGPIAFGRLSQLGDEGDVYEKTVIYAQFDFIDGMIRDPKTGFPGKRIVYSKKRLKDGQQVSVTTLFLYPTAPNSLIIKETHPTGEKTYLPVEDPENLNTTPHCSLSFKYSNESNFASARDQTEKVENNNQKSFELMTYGLPTSEKLYRKISFSKYDQGWLAHQSFSACYDSQEIVESESVSTLFPNKVFVSYTNGQGIILNDEYQYKGAMDADGYPMGQGYMILSDQTFYQGTFEGTELKYGTVIRPAQMLRYHGQLQNGAFHGEGELTSGELVIQGYWEMGEPAGRMRVKKIKPFQIDLETLQKNDGKLPVEFVEDLGYRLFKDGKMVPKEDEDNEQDGKGSGSSGTASPSGSSTSGSDASGGNITSGNTCAFSGNFESITPLGYTPWRISNILHQSTQPSIGWRGLMKPTQSFCRPTFSFALWKAFPLLKKLI